MASRPKGYGLAPELAHKREQAYSKDLESECRNWIEAVLGESLSNQDLGADKFQECLRDGKVLCKLINVLQPGLVKKVNESKMAFKQMENIGNFLDAAEQYGVSKADLFQTVDLYEGQNMVAVVTGIQALGRKAGTKGYPITLGPKEAQANKRDFTDEQLKAGSSIIGLQAGTNKGASQSGMNFGLSRQVQGP